MSIARPISAIAALLLLSLTACSPTPETTPTPSPSPSPSPSASPSTIVTPSPSASVSPSPSPSVMASCPEWSEGMPAIDFNRYYGVCVGMPFVAIDISGSASCPWYAAVDGDDTLGWYVSALSSPDDPGTEIWFFRMQWILLPPSAAVAYDLPATPEGITIGSTEEALMDAYPTAVTMLIDDISRGPRDERVVAGPDGNSYVFDITDGRVSEITWGQRLSQGQNGELCAL